MKPLPVVGTKAQLSTNRISRCIASTDTLTPFNTNTVRFLSLTAQCCRRKIQAMIRQIVGMCLPFLAIGDIPKQIHVEIPIPGHDFVEIVTKVPVVWTEVDSKCKTAKEQSIQEKEIQEQGSRTGRAKASFNERHTRTRRKLPTFHNGGFILFLHIPKTGGTTIRLNLQKNERIDYHVGKSYSQYSNISPLAEEAIVNGTTNNTILFFEIHAKDSPSLLKLRKRLRRWRVTASKNKVDIFFFTLLRDSLPFALSHFNFFHVQKRNPTFEQCNATEENFIRLSLSNPQCQFLAHGEPSMRAQKVKGVLLTPATCDEVYDTLLDNMDWVGTTERLSNETLPLLSRLLHLPESTEFSNHRVTKNTSLVHLKTEALSLTAINKILSTTSLDRKLYESALEDFHFDMWEMRNYSR